jgi:hypothetical protein
MAEKKGKKKIEEQVILRFQIYPTEKKKTPT